MSGYDGGGSGTYGMMGIGDSFIDSLKNIALPTISIIKNKFLNKNYQDEIDAIPDYTKISTKTLRVYDSTLNHRMVGCRGFSLKTLSTNPFSTHSSDAQCYDLDGPYLGQV